MKLNKGYLINLITTFLSQACSAGLIIFLLPVLQERFSVEEFSNYGVLLSVILLVATLDFGLNIGLMRRLIHEPEKASQLISSTFFLFLLVFLVAFPILVLIFKSSFLKINGNTWLYAFFVVLLAVQTIIASLFDVILQSNNKIFIGKLVRIGKTILEFVVLYSLSYKGSTQLLLLGSSIVNTLFIGCLLFYSKKYVHYTIAVSQLNWGLLINHFRYSFWYFLNSIGVVMVFNTQVLILNSLSSKKEVASYILVTRFLDVVRLGATNFAIILFPSIAQKEANGEWNELRQTYFKMLVGITIMSGVILLFLLTAGQWVFQFWSGRADDGILQVFMLLSVFTVLIVIDNVSAVFLHALRLNRMQTIISIFQGILGLILGYLFLKNFGIEGFAIASIVALLLTNFIYNPAHLISQLNKNVLKSP